MISFAIRTPFCDKIVSYTRAELEQLEDNGYVPSGEKKADTGWLAFFIHPSTLSDNGNETMEYYSNTGAHLLSLEQFLYRLVKEPDYVFNAFHGLCKVTVYANEYFYERNPMRDGAPEDKNLWKTFANAPDRTFDLLVNTSHEISPTGSHVITRLSFPSVRCPSRRCLRRDPKACVSGGGKRERDTGPGLYGEGSGRTGCFL